ncbi:NUDIX domain-containing protein [Shimwellia pseudoproteus]|uniref:nucleotide triphosphate diphosphatase NUDT15 n=1 Tax=Shimwellia pseudoproteus TaxID=570012 RepID=UPI0018ECD95D|nr:NUDIX domain-containing protein [Shimwellia pseudoproteus]MBJ3816541.1 NUDIX domain-containing protein [Shimwellia pseudoproteus]
MAELPRFGVGILIVRQGKILLGQRLGSHGEGCWSAPGGHLEPGESVEQCARRETLEETGLQLGSIMRGPWSEDYFPRQQKHYLTMMVVARPLPGEPHRLEPDKCAGWQWFSPDTLPAPLFAPLEGLARDQGKTLAALIARINREDDITVSGKI